jgi:hypothetical protein
VIKLSDSEELDKLKGEIHYLSQLFDYIESHPTDGDNYRKFWDQVKYTSNLFKESKQVSHIDRQSLWEEFSTLCEETKKFRNSLTEENASILAHEISSLSFIYDSIRIKPSSDRHYGSFWDKVNEIKILFKELKPINPDDRQKYWEEFSNLCETVKYEQQERSQIFNSISHEHYSNIMGLLDISDVDTNNVELLKSAGSYLKQAGAMLSEYKGEMTSHDKKKCFERILEIRRTHDYCWSVVNEERNQRRSDFESRVKANLQKNYERLNEAHRSLDYLKDKAEELQDKIYSAWNDEWASRAEGWLSELEEKISDKENHIRRIESWIEEDEGKLN